MRTKYITGLDEEELDELTARIEELLPEPWNKPTGRPKKLSLRDAIAITSAYERQNIIQDVLAEIWDISQGIVSEIITAMTPLIEQATREFVPTAEEAIELVTGRACLLDGNVFFVSDPVPGSVHDSVAITLTPVADILTYSGGVIADKGYQGCGYATPRKKPKGGELSISDKRENANVSRLRAPVERAMAHIKSWRILHTDYRRPLKTYLTSFRAALGLFFFRAAFQSPDWSFQ